MLRFLRTARCWTVAGNCVSQRHDAATLKQTPTTTKLNSPSSDWTQQCGVGSHLADWKLPAEITLHTDSSSARAVTMWRGVGKNARHIQTRFFWLQERVAAKRLLVRKTHTNANPADVLSKALPETRRAGLAE
eukprot:1357411-Amphidinium_carterae.1